ncbi:hypothetical protein AVEN_59249-1 [Araneus ventricosus]|uniref:Uncharacterized protein n=1 Tax=Araneus ventricosus TaxID=182803 RepID=A0A4Y2CYU7_ARAVE|nr:hypothetical protein AVEN_59249-1 [Araneus ventricosus]
MSLPSNLSLMVGKRVLHGYVWECQGNEAIHPDLGDHFGDFGDEMWGLKSTGIFLISLLGTEIRICPDDSIGRHGLSERPYIDRARIDLECVLIDFERVD